MYELSWRLPKTKRTKFAWPREAWLHLDLGKLGAFSMPEQIPNRLLQLLHIKLQTSRSEFDAILSKISGDELRILAGACVDFLEDKEYGKTSETIILSNTAALNLAAPILVRRLSNPDESKSEAAYKVLSKISAGDLSAIVRLIMGATLDPVSRDKAMDLLFLPQYVYKAGVLLAKLLRKPVAKFSKSFIRRLITDPKAYSIFKVMKKQLPRQLAADEKARLIRLFQARARWYGTTDAEQRETRPEVRRATRRRKPHRPQKPPA